MLSALTDSSTRRRSSLNGAWRYCPDAPQYAFGESLGWWSADLDDSAWASMELPACWDIADPGLHAFEGLVWFRRRFTLTEAPSRPTFLRFEGVNYRADVWLNDVALGAHEGGYTPFAFRADSELRAGENVLVVCVDNRPLPERIPGARLSWFNFGGIYREVLIEERPAVAITDVWLDPLPTRSGGGGPAEVALSITLSSARSTPATATVRVTVAGIAWEQRAVVPPSGELTLTGTLGLDDVPYWSPDTPRLLQAEISASCGDELDHMALEIGVRHLTAEGAALLLNGVPIRIAGFNRHEDYPTTGRSHDETQLWSDLRQIKASGANFVRAGHCPNHPRFYQACDRLGLMVMDEIPLWGWGRGIFEDGGAEPAAPALRQLEELIRRDRNHACVVIWSVSNETGGGSEQIDRVNLELMALARRLDPGRLVTHVTVQGVWQAGEDQAFAADDLICINEYEGTIHFDPPVRSPEEQGPVLERLVAALDTLHARFPTKPVLVTEFGATGIPGHHGPTPWSEESQGAFIASHWSTLTVRPYVVGALLWSWQDYAKHPNRQRWYPMGLYGIYTRERRPKAGAAQVEALMRAYLSGSPEA